MKIIFLDVDGVLNNHFDYQTYGFNYIDSGLVEILKTIVAATGSEIVISSTWRLSENDLSLIRANLRYKRLDFIDVTPDLRKLPRAEEIKSWLKNNPQVVKYAILDDNEDAGLGLEGFFKTDYYVGLTNEIAEKVINYLNNN